MCLLRQRGRDFENKLTQSYHHIHIDPQEILLAPEAQEFRFIFNLFFITAAAAAALFCLLAFSKRV